MEVVVGDLPVPGAEHPERVEDDGHAGKPHDGVGRLERRLHAAPHHPPRHADADAAVAGRSKTCCGSDSPSSASLSWARLGRRSVRLTFFFCSANEAGKRRWQDGGSTQQQPARAGEAETGRVARSCFLRGRVWFDVGWWDLVEAVDEWSPAAADCRGGEFPTADGDGCNKRRCYAWSGVVDASPSRMASAVLLVYFCFVLV